MRGTAVVLALLCVSADAGLFRKLLSPPEGLYRGCFDELRRVLADPSFPKSVNEKLRFDEFTRGLALQNQDNYARWPNMTSLYVVPPSISSPLPSTTVGLAEDIVVPTLDETWPAASQEEANESIAYSESLPFPHTSWHVGRWYDGEDKKASIDALIGTGTNPLRTLVPWGEEKYTDQGFADYVFKGIGQHRVVKVRAGDADAKGATYAVYLGFMEQFEVRPGFARHGANAYFNAEGQPTHIVRLGRTYYPSVPGWEKHTEHGLSWRECRELDGWYKCFSLSRGLHPCECKVPAKIGFKSAKFAFLSTLNTVITFVDHLYWGHLTVANSIVSGNVQELGVHHRLRALMHPFTFRTAEINWRAAFSLVNEYGLVHRSSSFSADGLKELFKFVQTEEGGLQFMTIPERFAAQGFTSEDKVQLPLHEDGADFYQIVRKYVRTHLTTYYDYPTNACGKDEGISAWMTRANSISPRKDLPTGEALTCEKLEDVLSTFVFTVTGYHAHVGQIAAEVNDPCHSPWAWREGELCGPPRTTFTMRFVMEATSLPQPKLLDDYTHVLRRPGDKARWLVFQEELAAFGKVVDSRNANRTRPFRSFDMDVVEVSIGI